MRAQKGTDLFVTAMCRLLPRYPDFTAVIVGETIGTHRAFAERERANAAMRQFIADAGHQLRTPLTVIRGFIAILRKGANPMIDSYSAFAEADGLTTGLAALLRARGIERVFVGGLATDFCVAYSALDARAAGFATFVIEDACRGIDADGSLAAAWAV